MMNRRILAASLAFSCAAVSALGAANPYESGPAAKQNQIDELVFARQDQLKVTRSDLCSDAVFVRRAYFDIIGTLPTGFEAQEFILDRKSGKRAALIKRLLERDEFADYWSMKWCDLLRVKAEFPINLWPNAVQSYHRWIRDGIRDNKPYDQFARELLTSSGSNFRVPPVNFYRAMQNHEPSGMAQAVALTLMGERAEKWPEGKLSGMAAFFGWVGFKSTSEWKEEIVFFDPARATNAPLTATFPDGTSLTLKGDRDPREIFSEWLVRPENRWFTRNIANRVWSWLMGRGIIHEPDDIRPDNKPSNAALLSHLEQELIASKYDLKHLYSLILNSATYQLSAVPKDQTAEAEANFAYYPLRRLEAEVIIDALNQITGGTERYSSAIPEPFTFIPEDQRSIALSDGSISSPFLEMFGRPARDSGLESERNNRPTPAQRLHFLNSSQVQRKIEQSRMIQFQTQGGRTRQQAATGIYLGILSRFPTAQELKTIESFSPGSVMKREAAVDLAWALLNSSEFLYRH